MLLQPYVENAIRHGIRFLQNKHGLIEINIQVKDNFIEYIIDDNGIGREAAQRQKKMNHIEYQSRGMQISNRRAQLYNIGQTIIDKKNAHGEALGTTIILQIPKQLN
jgi:sensor histidine kinase YesM